MASRSSALEDTRPFVECLRSGRLAGDVCPDSVAVYRRKMAELDGLVARLELVRTHLEAQLAKVTASPVEESTCSVHRTA